MSDDIEATVLASHLAESGHKPGDDPALEQAIRDTFGYKLDVIEARAIATGDTRVLDEVVTFRRQFRETQALILSDLTGIDFTAL